MYIAFEGLDGCGKTTQIDKLKALNLKNVAFTKEPFYFNKQIKYCLHHTKFASPVAHTLLFMACHAEAIARWPKEKYVISDRSIYSSLAYSYGYNGSLAEKVKNTLRMYNMDFYPQIVFYLRMSVNDLDRRIFRRNQKKDNIELKDIGYFKRIYQFYEQQKTDSKTIWITLNANQHPDILHKQIMKHLAKEIL